MKIFEKGDKINFVDEDNVFVGYDLSQSCCENAGWFLSRNDNECRNVDGLDVTVEDLTDFRIDGGYFKEIEMASNEDGNMAQFRMINVNNDDIIYIYFFNIHNGYYGHGFDANIGGIEWQSGAI